MHAAGFASFALGREVAAAKAASWLFFWEEKGKSIQPLLERVPLSHSLLHLYPS
jgi:hypothetical protein